MQGRIYAARACLSVLTLGVAALAQDYPWYLVDATSVVCTASQPPAPGYANIPLDLRAMITPSDMQTPHVITFYRTSNKTVNIWLKVMDSASRQVIGNTMVSLKTYGARRLGDLAPLGIKGRGVPVGPVEMEETLDEDIQEAFSEGWDARPPRRLSGRRRSGGPRRRSSSSSGPPRRRSNPASARRRGSSTSGAAQSQYGIGNSRYTNANGQAYGYTNQQQMSYSYPSGYTTTAYGYSGPYAYSSYSGRTVVMAAAGGTALGFASMYVYSRWSSYNYYCTNGAWRGSCYDCRRTQPYCSPAPPYGTANRDDLMQTGFWPDDWASPLTVTISRIEGVDFDPAKICPPSPTWNTSVGQDIFLTLTKVSELGDELSADDDGPDPVVSALSSVASIIFCCGCCVALPLFCFYRLRKAARAQETAGGYSGQPYGSPQPYSSDPYAQPYATDQYGQPYAQPYGQPQPYGQGPIAMGQPVGPPLAMGQVVQATYVQGGIPQATPYQPGMAAHP